MPWLKWGDDRGERRETRRLLRRNKSGVGLTAFGLHALASLHAAKYMTDGRVDAEFIEETLDDSGVVGRAREQLVKTLVDNGLWEFFIADGEWEIVGYLEDNPTAEEIESRRAAEREKKRAAGRKGAATRWQKNGSQPRDDQ